MTATADNAYHPDILAAAQRHKEFFEGRRPYLVKIEIPVQPTGPQEREIPFDELDWERDFDANVRAQVANAVSLARTRLDMKLGDDWIPCYHPYFGISIHVSFFGGAVHHGGGTSYADPVILRAADWEQLRADFSSPWPQRLGRGLAYCRDHGQGVLLASFRGANGPLDMANGVLGNALFSEYYDNPQDVHRVLKVCWPATLAAFEFQKKHCSKILGGHIVPMGNVWMPDPCVGHVSLDAACLSGPDSYEEFEVPYLARIVERVRGMFIHTHMMAWKMFANKCRTPGVWLFHPVDDPGQPKMLDKIDPVIEAAGDVPLLVEVNEDRFGEILPRFKNKRALIWAQARDASHARKVMEQIDRYCPLER